MLCRVLGSGSLVQPAAQRLKFFLEAQFLSFQLSQLQVVESGKPGGVLDNPVEIAVPVAQFTDTGFNGHRVSLHVCLNVG